MSSSGGDPTLTDPAFITNDARVYTGPRTEGDEESGTGRGARYYAEHRHGGYRAARRDPGCRGDLSGG